MSDNPREDGQPVNVDGELGYFIKRNPFCADREPEIRRAPKKKNVSENVDDPYL